MPKRRVERMSLAHAVPPDQRMVCSHRGSARLIALLVYCCQDMETGLVPWVLLEGAPLIGPRPYLRQPSRDRPLLGFDPNGGGHNWGMHNELRAQKRVHVPAPSRRRPRRRKNR